MCSNKPAIVIVHGAWHEPSHCALLHDSLEQADYEVTTCDVPSTGPKEPHKDISQDIDTIQQAVKSYIEKEMNVVLVMHSIAALAGCCAAKGIQPQDTTDGEGLISLVFICAFIVDEGVSVVIANGGAHSLFVRPL